MKRFFDPLNLLCSLIFILPAVSVVLVVLKLCGLFPFSWLFAAAPIVLTLLLSAGFFAAMVLLADAEDADVEAMWEQEAQKKDKKRR